MINWIHESRGFLTLSEDFVSKRQHGRVHVPRVGRVKFASLSTRPSQNRFSLGSYRRSNRVAVPRDREPLRAILGGWGGWIRTIEWRLQRPLPYHLATPQREPIVAQICNAAIPSQLYLETHLYKNM